MSINPKNETETRQIHIYKKVGVLSMLLVKMTDTARRFFRIVKGIFVKDKSEPALPNAIVLAECVPAYTWSGGRSASAGGMAAAYLDSQYPNLIDGVMPLDDNSMPEYTDADGDTYKINPATTSAEIYTEYWEGYERSSSDPFTGGSAP